MRLGGPVKASRDEPEAWVQAVKGAEYRAAYCPLDASADDMLIRAYRDAAEKADIVIAEVGAWSNPLSRDDRTRKDALAYCKRQLELADRIGARCCVNIAGSRGETWDGPHPDNVSDETFQMIVQNVREILDEVKPARAFFTLEPMPWTLPDSPGSYRELLRAIDRPMFGVHLDPVNLINSPRAYYQNGAFVEECFRVLGPYIVSCHAKDIRIAERLTVHLDEVRPGLGQLDYRTLLREMAKLSPDTPFLLEHLGTSEEYVLAASYVRGVASEMGLAL